MKSIYETFNDDDFNKMVEAKEKLKLTWAEVIKRGLRDEHKRRTKKSK